MKNRPASAVILTLLSVSIIVSHVTEMIFPWLPLAILCIALFLLFSPLTTGFRVTAAVFSMAMYLSYTFSFAYPALLGRDPDKVAVAISRILEFEGLGGISEYYFYSSVPGFHAFVASIASITGLPAKQSLMLFGVSSPFFVIPSAVLLARQIDNPDAVKYAAVLSIAPASLVYWSFTPVPQMFAVFLWGPFLVLTQRYFQTKQAAGLLLLAPIVISLMFSHKLSMIVAAGCLISGLLVYLLRNSYTSLLDWSEARSISNVSIILLMLGAVQTLWLTDLLRSTAISRTGSITDGQVGAPNTELPEVLATPLLPRPLEIIVGNISWVSLTLTAGVAWIITLWWFRDRRIRQTLLLAASGVTGGFVIISYLASTSLGTTRVVLFATVPFVALISIALSIVGQTDFRPSKGLKSRLRTEQRAIPLTYPSPPTRKALGHAIVVLLVISQLIVTPIAPDHPYGVRQYLTPEETDGKEWTNNHVTDTVAADFFYAREVVDYDEPGQTYITGTDAVAKGYRELLPGYITGSIVNESYPYILYRPNYDVFPAITPWRLTWDPEQGLDEVDNRVFDNGGSILYAEPTVSSNVTVDRNVSNT